MIVRSSAPSLLLALTAALPLACSGDDTGDASDSATSIATAGMTTSASSTATDGTAATEGTAATTAATGSASESAGTTSAGETTTATTMATTEATTTATTSPVTDTDATTEGCVCTPGATDACEGPQILTCADDCQGFVPADCPSGTCQDGACVDQLCAPGTQECEGPDATKTCNAQGDGYDPPTPCGMTQECAGAGVCVELCDLIETDSSSVGCVFRANKMQNFIEEPSAIAIGNVSETKTAAVSLFYNGNMIEGPLQVPPGMSHVFNLTMPGQPGAVSVLRPDSTFKVVSDVPVVAYLHSPIAAAAHNDSSMLLPDHAQQSNYIIAAYTPTIGGNPAYINVVGLEDGTEVSWTPPVATVAGNGVPAVAAKATGKVTIGDYDLLQISSGQADLSGTLVTTSKPAWVVGAVQCVNIPSNVTYCDHIEEQMIPLEYWGETYVGAHAPKRGNEKYYWRIYGGDDGVTVTAEPAQPGFPVNLNKGQFYEFSTQQSVIFAANGPFMPVQYLEGQNGGAGTGDPASYQMVPVEQFLSRYVFVTGIGYDKNYAQIVREAGGAEVFVDGAMVTGYTKVGEYEVADWSINEGSHLAESAMAFGIYQVGYTNVTSYAYPGGLRLKVINPQ